MELNQNLDGNFLFGVFLAAAATPITIPGKAISRMDGLSWRTHKHSQLGI